MTLEEMASSNKSDTGSRASGLLETFSKGKTVLGLMMGSEVIGELENLNKSLQKETQTICGMREALQYVRESLQAKRNEESFHHMFQKAEDMVSLLDIDPIEMPRQRKPKKRYSCEAEQHVAKSAEDFVRAEFYRVLDTIEQQFEERFSQADLATLHKLEMVLLTGQVSEVVEPYPELEMDILRVQLHMFLLKHQVKSSGDAASILRGMPVEVRGLFDQVEALVRVLLVVPVSSTEAERSFSALRRLKTWLRSWLMVETMVETMSTIHSLRSTMSQERLNHTAVCHVHKGKMDEVNLKEICWQFVSVNERRRYVFGSYT